MSYQYGGTREYRYEGDVLYLKCTQCGERKQQDYFPKDKSSKFGIKAECKKCKNIKSRFFHKRWYENNKEHSNESCRDYHEKNKDRLNMSQKIRSNNHSKDLGFSWELFH